MKLLLLLALPFLSGCGASDSHVTKIGVASLLATPERFAGKRVEVDAILFLDFEVMVVRDPAKSHQDEIWFDYADYPANENDSRGFPALKTAFERSRREDASPMRLTARATVVGAFEHSKAPRFGHLGGFRSKLSIERVISASPHQEEPNKAPEPTPGLVTPRARK